MDSGRPSFLILGMGNRRKLLYVPGGRLVDAVSLEPLRTWVPHSERIEASEYRVTLETQEGDTVRIVEDEEAVWVEEAGRRDELTRGSAVRLPRFEGHPQAPLLRALHAEILVNLMPFGPVPNLWVYPRPWYRDAAMMLMCLQHTGNLGLVEPWAMGLHKVWDRNNAGDPEADNLGQALYVLSLFGDRRHPLVEAILAVLPRYRKGDHIVGRSDGAEHPVYQTKWLKYGLRAQGLDDPYAIPAVMDSYGSLFWMDYRESHVAGPRFSATAARNYPYLAWAEAHFYGEAPPAAMPEIASPLTWEGSASEAEYWRLGPLERIGAVPATCVRERVCYPHTWHAAEMFLYYWKGPLVGSAG